MILPTLFGVALHILLVVAASTASPLHIEFSAAATLAWTHYISQAPKAVPYSSGGCVFDDGFTSPYQFNSSDDARLDTLHSSGLLDIGAGMDLDEALDGLEIPAGFIGDADAAPPVAEDPAGFIGDVADAAPPVAEEMQVDGLDQFGELDAAALVPKRKFEKNSALHIANAREALYRKRAKTSSQKLKVIRGWGLQELALVATSPLRLLTERMARIGR
eukprot:9483569-Pyramimonas_sp.AAC.1